MKDPFQVVMKQTRLPISLLQEKAKVVKNLKRAVKIFGIFSSNVFI